MSSERYDEAVREQKKAERKKQVQKQVMILVIVLLVIAAAVAAVVIGGQKKEKDSQPKDKADISSTVSAIAASYEEFLADVDADASKEDRKQDAKKFAEWLEKTYPKETAEKLQKKVKSDALKEADFYASYEKTLHVLSDEYQGYLKDDATAAQHQIYQKQGNTVGQAEIALGGNLTLTEEGMTLGIYDQSGELKQMLSEELLNAMTQADVFFLNQECSISSEGEALEGKGVLHANADRMKILEGLGADVVSLGNEHAADFGQDALKENLELLKNAKIAAVGAGADANQAKQPVYLIVNGIKIGFTAASGVEDTFDLAAGEGKAGIQEYTDTKQYEDVIREAAANCDYLIVYDHEGKGDTNNVEAYQKEHAAAFLEAGADLVLGGHSDRLQGMEYINGKPVVYSMGSVLTDGTSRYAGILKLTIKPEGLEQMEIVPAIQTEEKTEYLDAKEEQKKMYDAVAALCPNAVIDENGVITEKK
ncbi:CapA family protein [Mediterraneibacter gnavus]|uniref:CapA family protein n=1 Tax=Mediterraneibacter gnavus TaxID=33038 RepID=A0A414UWV6_MEDGN|nr:CapA family protein [Mediterraneibacter gnavus]RHG72739.1 CapA family protein [Mediterraneibacter gnavus]RHG85993.1 CapA family protein [Mediterraneibacter gnavus]